MRVAGFGFRAGASLASLQDALQRALDLCDLRGAAPHGLAALATAEDKTGAACIQALAARLHLPVRAVSPEEIAAMTTLTDSARVRAMRRTGSVAEAAALAAVGQCGGGGSGSGSGSGGGSGSGSSGEPALLHARAVSADRLATCAIARFPCVRGLRS